MVSIPKEAQKLCDKLQEIAKKEKNAELARQLCLAEIELTEMLVAAKYKATPLATRLLFKMALEKQLPEEVKNLLEGGISNAY